MFVAPVDTKKKEKRWGRTTTTSQAEINVPMVTYKCAILIKKEARILDMEIEESKGHLFFYNAADCTRMKWCWFYYNKDNL